jgi:hypothetical protein
VRNPAVTIATNTNTDEALSGEAPSSNPPAMAIT